MGEKRGRDARYKKFGPTSRKKKHVKRDKILLDESVRPKYNDCRGRGRTNLG